MKNFKVHLLIPALLLIIFSSCTNDDTAEPELPLLEQSTIWSGPKVTFEKANGTDPTSAANQDRITDEVWITRGMEGQIFNAVTESSADKDDSPEGTLWAKGTTADLENLNFGRFRSTLGKPRENVGVDLVLLLVEENIAIDLKFTSWSSNQMGGFAYERSSE